MPEVTAFTRLTGNGQQRIFEVNNELFQTQNTFYVDSTFFEFFDFELLYGDRSEVLDEPLMVVLTEKAALRYFGKKNAVGEILDPQRESRQPLFSEWNNGRCAGQFSYEF